MNPPRVLLADDHRALFDRLSTLLQPTFEIIGAVANGAELVSEALRLQPDVIVSDISMPVLNGIEAVHKLREAGCSAKFIFLTLHQGVDFVNACLAEGASGYVAKLDMTTELLPAIHEALSGRQFVSSSVSRHPQGGKKSA